MRRWYIYAKTHPLDGGGFDRQYVVSESLLTEEHIVGCCKEIPNYFSRPVAKSKRSLHSTNK